MKKASSIVLLIAGILDIIAGSIVILTSWAAMFFTLPWGIFLLLAGIFALVARKKETKGMYITTIVFGVLSLELISLTGAILGLVAASTEKK